MLSCMSTFFLFVFLGPHPQHMGVLRVGFKSKLQLPAYTTATATPDLSPICDLHHSSWQLLIPNLLSKARDQTHNFMVASQIHFRCTTMGTSVWVLYILDINPFLNVSFAIIFYSVGDLFFLIDSFLSFLAWCSSICLFLFLFLLPKETYSKKMLLRPVWKSVLSMFSCRSFMFSCLTFKTLIHFGVFLLGRGLYGVRK